MFFLVDFFKFVKFLLGWFGGDIYFETIDESTYLYS